MLEKIIKKFKDIKPEEIKVEYPEDTLSFEGNRYIIKDKGFKFELRQYTGPDVIGMPIIYDLNILKHGKNVKTFSSYWGKHGGSNENVDEKKLKEIYEDIKNKMDSYEKRNDEIRLEKDNKIRKENLKELNRIL